MIMLDRLLRGIREHRVGAAESDDGGFAEKDSFAKNGVLRSEKNSGKGERQRPYHDPSHRTLERMKPHRFRATTGFTGKIDIKRLRNFAAKVLRQNPAPAESKTTSSHNDSSHLDAL